MPDLGPTPARVGRYLLYEEIARGGMASVHVGRLEGPAGFKRTVAVKRLHGSYGLDPEFVSQFLDEARIAARIEHPNVVPVLDVVSVEREVLLVMEYVHGESLAVLLEVCQQRKVRAPLRVVAQIMVNVLTGLHAAHETLGDLGAPLRIIHRDVSPHNVMVSADGIARVVDFGIARAERRITATTKEGNVRGKLAYMAPEQLAEVDVDRRADIYAAALVFWEAVVGRRLFDQDASVIIARKMCEDCPLPSQHVEIPAAIESIIMKGLSAAPTERYATALEMARAIEDVVPPVSPREVAEWVAELVPEKLRERAQLVASSTGGDGAAPLERVGLVASPTGHHVSSQDITLPRRRYPSARLFVGLTALLAASAIGTCALVARTYSGAEVEARAAAVPLPPAPLPATPASAAAPPVAPASSAPGEAASAGMASPASPRARTKGAAHKASVPSSAALASARRSACEPPWRIDARGVRILKKECF